MLSRMSAAELDEWMLYARIEPFGEERADLRMGILASLIANVNRAKGADAFTPSDFIPVFDAEPEPELTEEGAAMIEAFKAHAERVREKSV